MNIDIKNRKAKFSKADVNAGLCYWNESSLGEKALIYLIKLDFMRNGNVITPEDNIFQKYYMNPRLYSILFAALYRARDLPEACAIKEELTPCFKVTSYYEVPGESNLQPIWKLKNNKKTNWDEVKFKQAEVELQLYEANAGNYFKRFTDDLIFTAMTVPDSEFEKSLSGELRARLDLAHAEEGESWSVNLSKLLVNIRVNAQFAMPNWESTAYLLNHCDLDKIYQILFNGGAKRFFNSADLLTVHQILLKAFRASVCIPYVELKNIIGDNVTIKAVFL